jgi:hypothetical protein
MPKMKVPLKENGDCGGTVRTEVKNGKTRYFVGDTRVSKAEYEIHRDAWWAHSEVLFG